MLPKVLEEGIGQFCGRCLLVASGAGEDCTDKDSRGSPPVLKSACVIWMTLPHLPGMQRLASTSFGKHRGNPVNTARLTKREDDRMAHIPWTFLREEEAGPVSYCAGV